MQLHSVIEDAATIVSEVAESMGQPCRYTASWTSTSTICIAPTTDPDLMARVFGSGVARATVDTAAHVL